MRRYDKIINNAIIELNKLFSKTPYVFFSEADIRSKLFEILSKNKVLRETKPIVLDRFIVNNKKTNLKNIKTTRMHTEYVGVLSIFDLVIVEQSDLEVTRRLNKKVYCLDLRDNKYFQAIIELKSSRTRMGVRAKSNFKLEIIKDLNKIKKSRYISAYCLIFDFNNYLSEKDILKFKNIGGEINIVIFNIKEKDFLSNNY